MARKNNFLVDVKFHLLCLRDTVFFVVVSVFPLSLVLFKDNSLTWYVMSGYIYGLVSSSIMNLCKKSRRSQLNLSVEMIKLVFLLATFVMILINKSTDRIPLIWPVFAVFGILFLCLYYETYRASLANRK